MGPPPGCAHTARRRLPSRTGKVAQEPRDRLHGGARVAPRADDEVERLPDLRRHDARQRELLRRDLGRDRVGRRQRVQPAARDELLHHVDRVELDDHVERDARIACLLLDEHASPVGHRRDDERQPREPLERDGRAPRLRVARLRHQAQRHIEEGLALAEAGRRRQRDDAEVDASVGEAFLDLARRSFRDLQAQVADDAAGRLRRDRPRAASSPTAAATAARRRQGCGASSATNSGRRSTSAVSASARGRSRRPADVRRAPRPVRSNRRTASWRSSAPMRLLTADCVEEASVAAREKLPVAATWRNNLSGSSSIGWAACSYSAIE